MKHETIVAVGPAGTSVHLFADKAVSAPNLVIGVRGLVVEVAELAVKLLPLRVVDGEEAVFHLKGVLVINPQIGACKFGRPAVEILAIEQGNPDLFIGLGLDFGFPGDFLTKGNTERQKGG